MPAPARTPSTRFRFWQFDYDLNSSPLPVWAINNLYIGSSLLNAYNPCDIELLCLNGGTCISGSAVTDGTCSLFLRFFYFKNFKHERGGVVTESKAKTPAVNWGPITTNIMREGRGLLSVHVYLCRRKWALISCLLPRLPNNNIMPNVGVNAIVIGSSSALRQTK